MKTITFYIERKSIDNTWLTADWFGKDFTDEDALREFKHYIERKPSIPGIYRLRKMTEEIIANETHT